MVLPTADAVNVFPYELPIADAMDEADVYELLPANV